MNKEEMKKWARKEVDLAKIQCDPENVKSYENYEVAYQTYCKLLDKINNLNGKSEISSVLIDLLCENCLTPIEDIDDAWELQRDFYSEKDGKKIRKWATYQSKRKASLFKKITFDEDGKPATTSFSDVERYVCVDINTKQMYRGGIGEVILNEVLPIKMPYQSDGKITVYTENFKYHDDAPSDFDTSGVLYIQLPNGMVMTVLRFFKIHPDTQEIEEIDKHEYFARKKKVDVDGSPECKDYRDADVKMTH